MGFYRRTFRHLVCGLGMCCCFLDGCVQMTDEELVTAIRLRNGIEQIEADVQKLNDMGMILGIPLVSIRFAQNPTSPFGEVHYINHVADLISEERASRFLVKLQADGVVHV